MRGYDVCFLTGSDEHGQKIERKAKSEGLQPIEYVDKIVASFQNLWEKLMITNTDFLRTSQDRHKKVVQEIFTKLHAQGDIYKSEYEGWYCTPCETFWPETKLVGGNCPDCERPAEHTQEESYFFKMGKYADRLLKHIEDNPEFIQPVSRRNEMVNFIKQGLEDLSVSRTTFDWGIPVPFDPKHVVYVWVDALTNYISALGYGADDDQLFEKYWPADIHLVGKDIVRFHTIIWPILLMAIGAELPKKVFGHGWLLLAEGKMSKSKGNVVDPLELIEKYGVDAIRYFLMRELPFGSDGYYSEDAMINRINIDLANDFGNLVSRTTAMLDKFNGGIVPAPGAPTQWDAEIQKLAVDLVAEGEGLIEKLEFSNALATIWKLVNRANKYIDESAPWALAKDPEKKAQLDTVLYNLAEIIRISAVFITPFMPTLPEKIFTQMGITEKTESHTWDSITTWGHFPTGLKISRGLPLFPRIEYKEEEKVTDQKAPEKVTMTAPVIVEEAKPVEQELISIDDFMKVDLRVAEVMAAEKVEKADKLLKLTLKVGEEERTVVSGIALQYKPEDLIGKKLVLVANLKPVKIRGIMSYGMILAASDEGKLEVLTVTDIPAGTKVK
jgi:methionyl-tRNA synthetase